MRSRLKPFVDPVACDIISTSIPSLLLDPVRAHPGRPACWGQERDRSRRGGGRIGVRGGLRFPMSEHLHSSDPTWVRRAEERVRQPLAACGRLCGHVSVERQSRTRLRVTKKGRWSVMMSCCADASCARSCRLLNWTPADAGRV